MSSTTEIEVPEGEVLITRDTFIPDDLEYIGATRAETMVIFVEEGADGDVEGEDIPTEGAENGVSMKRVPVPESIRRSGVLPDGYSIDLILDPAIVVGSMRKSGLLYESQLPEQVLENLKETMFTPENMCIVPTSLYEDKLRLILDGVEKVANGEVDDDDEGEWVDSDGDEGDDGLDGVPSKSGA